MALVVSEASAQGSPPATAPGNAPSSSGSQQQGFGGPPAGQQQQQELQRRRQQMQQTNEQQSSAAPTPALRPNALTGSQGGATGQGSAGSALAASDGTGAGVLGEPRGTTTPRATVGGALRNSSSQGVQAGAARVLTVAPEQLNLADAIAIGLDNNLTTLLATERAEEARALQQQVRSFLLPNITGTAYQQNRTLNLAAQGLGGGGDEMAGGMGGGAAPIPSFVGPFNTFDARLNFSQTILNLAALREYKSSKAAVQVADLTAQLAREQVATFVALAYLTAQRSNLEVQAARADYQLAAALRELAVKQRNAGVANGIDVVRAESRAAQERLRVVQAEANAEQTRLDLERAIGLPQGSATQLTDSLVMRTEAVPLLDVAVQQALTARLDTRIAEQTIEQRALDRKARAAARYPTVNAVGDYGQSANTPFRNDRATRTYGVQLSLPVFDGGYTRGRINAALSRQRQAEWQLGNSRGQVEQDVRTALVGWRLGAEQVRASEEQFQLATRELELATQRFRAGVADNTEVIEAQAGLANARALRVQALAQYGAARLNFAAATGTAQSFRL
ncbi:TolC family protein [Hymenobacter sp. BT186]|uniref:TolC family protein n=1 Tax=Hymenobacter telluris TaxID=2816474 RepID=A0A939F2G1_9BACT|nr:TolC family protein [Hymenobacter telluris]MBO0361117.1 TolC family protein [Hymenobacter telluris]MBW3377145.1 TolC family protein [Hymenobacter norwichensis]